MNWEAGTMKEEFDRKPGLAPAMWKYGIGWIGGTPLQKNTHQTFMLNGKYGWYLDGAGSPPVAVPPDIAEIWPVELYLNPHGFLKAAALPGANPKAVWRWELGEMGRDGPEVAPEKMRVVSITVLGKYRVDATINKENRLQRIHTWVPNPVLGDMNYEHEFTNDSYIDIGNGIKFPTGWHSHEGWDDNFQAQARQHRPQCVWRHLERRQGERLPGPGGRPRLRAAGDVPRSRGDHQAGRRRLPARRRDAPQRGDRVRQFHRGLRGAAERAAAAWR